MISHDMNVVAQYAKRIFVMNKGHLVFDGDKEELFENSEMLDMYNLDLPVSSMLAINLKKLGLVSFDKLPLTKETLYEIMQEGGKKYE